MRILVGRADNSCRKIGQFFYKNLTIFARKFNLMFFIYENLTSFAGKFEDFGMKIPPASNPFLCSVSQVVRPDDEHHWWCFTLVG